VLHAPCLDHPLLPERDRDERTQLDDLLLAEVLAQSRPERVVDALGVPDQVARVQERGLLTLRVTVGALEVQQLVVVALD
jgi:hypothetical protein